jgi:hypothetical protein
MSLRGVDYESDTQRIRVGLMVLMAGLVILLSGLVMTQMRQSAPPDEGVVASEPGKIGADQNNVRVLTGATILVMGIVLVVILVGATYAFIRVTRKYATTSIKKKSGPTATDDIWRMHKVPELDESDLPNGDDHRP